MFILKPDQQEVVDKVIAELRKGRKRILIVAPTGAGKTVIATDLSKRCIAKNNSLIFNCHRRELLDQTYKTFVKNGIFPAFIQGGSRPDVTNKAQVASVNTLVRRLDQYPIPDVVFWDECHHVAAGQWKQIFDYYKDAVHIGMSATPERLDGKTLGEFFEVMILAPTVSELIALGRLSPYEYFAPSVLDLSKLVKGRSEYTEASLEALDPTNKIVGDNIEHYKALAFGKRNVVFARNIIHSKEIVRRYNEAGIPARHLDGNTPTGERKESIKLFESGDVPVLSNVDLFSEGFDLPAIEVVSLLAKTMSLTKYLQSCGRGLRLCPEIGKTKAIILDHVSNYLEHGMPDDDREWVLNAEDKPKKKRNREDDAIRLPRCPQCKFVHRPALICPHCGYEFKADGKQIKEIAGKLVMVGSIEYNNAVREQTRSVRTFEEMVSIGLERGWDRKKIVKIWKSKTSEDLNENIVGLERIEKAFGYQHGWAYKQNELNKIYRAKYARKEI